MTSQHTQVADRMRDAHTAGLAGRVALVTGGSGGIGRALARRLAAEGTAVAVAYSAHGAAAEKTAAQAAEDGVQAMAVGADLRRPQAPAELVNAVERALGPVDVLVANAGTGRTRSWEAVSSADFDKATAVNLRAPFLLLAEREPGDALREWVARLAQYAMTKHGLAQALRAAASPGSALFEETYSPIVAALGKVLAAAEQASYAPDLIQTTSSSPWRACGRSTPQPIGKPGRAPCTTLYSPASKPDPDPESDSGNPPR